MRFLLRSNIIAPVGGNNKIRFFYEKLLTKLRERDILLTQERRKEMNFDKRLIKSQEIQYFTDDEGVKRKRILFRFHRAIPLEKKVKKIKLKSFIPLFDELK